MNGFITGKFRRHTHDKIKKDSEDRNLKIADVMDAAYQLWLEATEKRKNEAVRAAARRRRRSSRRQRG